MELIAEDFEEPEAMGYRPKDDDRFDRTLLPGVADFGYPRQLQYTIVDELPRDLLEIIGGVDESPGSDGALVLQGQGGRLVDVEEIFETNGFQVVWDEERVMKASGHLWERVSIEHRRPDVLETEVTADAGEPPVLPWRDVDLFDYPHADGTGPVLFWFGGVVYTGTCRDDIAPLIEEDPLSLTWSDANGAYFPVFDGGL